MPDISIKSKNPQILRAGVNAFKMASAHVQKSCLNKKAYASAKEVRESIEYTLEVTPSLAHLDYMKGYECPCCTAWHKTKDQSRDIVKKNSIKVSRVFDSEIKQVYLEIDEIVFENPTHGFLKQLYAFQNCLTAFLGAIHENSIRILQAKKYLEKINDFIVRCHDHLNIIPASVQQTQNGVRPPHGPNQLVDAFKFFEGYVETFPADVADYYYYEARGFLAKIIRQGNLEKWAVPLIEDRSSKWKSHTRKSGSFEPNICPTKESTFLKIAYETLGANSLSRAHSFSSTAYSNLALSLIQKHQLYCKLFFEHAKKDLNPSVFAKIDMQSDNLFSDRRRAEAAMRPIMETLFDEVAYQTKPVV